MRFARTILRVLVGVLFVGHGTQKLFGWFGGYGPDATGQAFDGMGMKPGKLHAQAAGLSETAGGALLAAGALTPVAASMITGTMTVAIETAHRPKGVWASDGGYEYNAVLIALVIALAAEGPGPFSVDEALGIERSGAVTALAALALGVGGAYAVLQNRSAPEQA
jgi:putative oxidoreductase